MTYALAADLHLHAWSQFSTIGKDGVNSRLRIILDEFEHMARDAVEAGCKRLYVAGDTFHVRGRIQPSVMNPVIDAFRRAARVIEVRIITGNHDLEGQDSDDLGNAARALHEIEGVSVYHHSAIFHDDKVVMVPWFHKVDALREEITRVADELRADGHDPARYDLHLHAPLNGVIKGIPDIGLDPHSEGTFGFKRLFAGHFHNQKCFEGTNVWSIGALTHQTWSDVGSVAGWLLVGGDFERCMESFAPKFRDYDPTRFEIEEYAGDYVRITGLDLEEAEIKLLRQELAKHAAGVVVHAVPKSKVVSRTGVTRASAASLESSVSDFIGKAEIEHRADVEQECLDILSEARGSE